jgi:speckle-type POZ protein
LIVGGHRWRIRFFPNGAKPGYEGFVSFFLHLDESVADSVKAQFQFCFVDNVEKKPVTLEAVSSFASNEGWGYPKFIKRKELEKSEHLKDDSFTVRCNIVVINEFGAKLETAVGAPPTPTRFVSVPPSDLHRNLGDLLLSEKGADVVFDVGGQTFAAHRCVLATRSPVFNAELLGTMKESNTTCVVRVDDMEAQVFKALLSFVYTDSLPKTEERGQGVCSLREKYVKSYGSIFRCYLAKFVQS